MRELLYSPWQISHNLSDSEFPKSEQLEDVCVTMKMFPIVAGYIADQTGTATSTLCFCEHHTKSDTNSRSCARSTRKTHRFRYCPASTCDRDKVFAILEQFKYFFVHAVAVVLLRKQHLCARASMHALTRSISAKV